MPNVPRLFGGYFSEPAGEFGNTTIRWFNGFDGLGDPIGNTYFGTEHWNFESQEANRVVKFNGDLFVFARDTIRKLNTGTNTWDAVYTVTDMQFEILPTNYFYSAHSGLYVVPCPNSPTGLILVGFYGVSAGNAFTQSAVLWSTTGDSGTWSRLVDPVQHARRRWTNIAVVGTTVYCARPDNIIIAFDSVTRSLSRVTRCPGMNMSGDIIVYQGKLLALVPSDVSGDWALFEFDGVQWIPVYTGVDAYGSLYVGTNASLTGKAAMVVVNADLYCFCPLNGGSGNYIFKVTFNAGVWSVTDVTDTMIGTTYTNDHGAFPGVSNSYWYSHVDNWTNAKVWYMWYVTIPNTYIFRNNGDGQSMDPLFVNAGPPPNTAASLIDAQYYGLSSAKRGEGDYTLGEEDQPDQGDTIVLIRTERRSDTGYRRIYFRITDGTGTNSAYRLRLLYDGNGGTPSTNAGNLKAIGGGSGSPTIPVTEDYIDDVVGDGVEQWLDWDDSGTQGTNGKLTLAIAWRVA